MPDQEHDNVWMMLDTLAECFDKASDKVFTGTEVADALRAIRDKLPHFRKDRENA